jgi:hypothetical protein
VSTTNERLKGCETDCNTSNRARRGSPGVPTLCNENASDMKVYTVGTTYLIPTVGVTALFLKCSDMKVYTVGTTYLIPTIGDTALFCFFSVSWNFPTFLYSKELNVLLG